jgi:hypothetical protein
LKRAPLQWRPNLGLRGLTALLVDFEVEQKQGGLGE